MRTWSGLNTVVFPNEIQWIMISQSYKVAPLTLCYQKIFDIDYCCINLNCLILVQTCTRLSHSTISNSWFSCHVLVQSPSFSGMMTTLHDSHPQVRVAEETNTILKNAPTTGVTKDVRTRSNPTIAFRNSCMTLHVVTHKHLKCSDILKYWQQKY